MANLLKQELKLSDYPNKYIFTKIDGKTFSFYMEGDVLRDMDVEEETSTLLNSIYVGKVRNISKNLDAAFVEFQKDQVAYLELKNVDPSQGVLNRTNPKNLAQGDELLIQIVKEPLKTKDAVASTNLTISGTYCVVSSQRKSLNFSGKLNRDFTKKLKDYLENCNKLKENQLGAIVRTNAETLEEQDFNKISDEIYMLQEKLQKLIKNGATRSSFTCLYQEGSFVEKKCKNISMELTDLVVTDQEDMFKEIQTFPELKSYLYKDESISLFHLLGLKKKIEEAFSKRVWLKCGGYLVIEVTEALTVIDVNSGKCITKKKKEELADLVNHQAALEAMHQIRLRNLSGIILIDFMKYDSKEKEKELIKNLHSLAKKERTQTEVIDMTALGLLEMTRKKVSKPLHEKLSISSLNL